MLASRRRWTDTDVARMWRRSSPTSSITGRGPVVRVVVGLVDPFLEPAFDALECVPWPATKS